MAPTLSSWSAFLSLARPSSLPYSFPLFEREQAYFYAQILREGNLPVMRAKPGTPSCIVHAAVCAVGILLRSFRGAASILTNHAVPS